MIETQVNNSIENQNSIDERFHAVLQRLMRKNAFIIARGSLSEGDHKALLDAIRDFAMHIAKNECAQ